MSLPTFLGSGVCPCPTKWLGNSWREQTKEPTTMTTADAIRPADDDDDDDDDGEPRRRRRVSRERGTPRGALPRRVSTILIVSVNAVCATLATALFLHSYSPPPSPSGTTAVVGYARVAFVACLGAASTSAGIVYGDSITHLLAFGVAVSAMMNDDILYSILYHRE